MQICKIFVINANLIIYVMYGVACILTKNIKNIKKRLWQELTYISSIFAIEINATAEKKGITL